MSLDYYRDLIRSGATPNVPPDLIEEVLEGLGEETTRAYLARRRR